LTAMSFVVRSEAMRATLLAMGLLAISGIQAQRLPVEPRPGHLIIDVVVVDRQGIPVLDVKPSELEVWIVGYRIPIETLTIVNPAADQPSDRTIALLLDDITLDLAVIPRAREAARQFVNRMSPDDRIAIVTLSGAAMEPTGDRARLLQRIDAYGPRASAVMRPDTMGAHVLQTVAALSRSLGGTTDRRKTIVAIGAAGLFDTPIPPPSAGRDLRPEWTDAMRAMAAANIGFYVLDPAGVGAARASDGSNGFARETGGLAFVNTNNVAEAADRIMREARSYYLIQVADPPMGQHDDLRALDVRVSRRGISVRARRAVPGTR
jgi:VWFA-related protein